MRGGRQRAERRRVPRAQGAGGRRHPRLFRQDVRPPPRVPASSSAAPLGVPAVRELAPRAAVDHDERDARPGSGRARIARSSSRGAARVRRAPTGSPSGPSRRTARPSRSARRAGARSGGGFTPSVSAIATATSSAVDDDSPDPGGIVDRISPPHGRTGDAGLARAPRRRRRRGAAKAGRASGDVNTGGPSVGVAVTVSSRLQANGRTVPPT